MLDLLRPIYRMTAANGHFGRDEPELTWERTDRAEALRRRDSSNFGFRISDCGFQTSTESGGQANHWPGREAWTQSHGGQAGLTTALPNGAERRTPVTPEDRCHEEKSGPQAPAGTTGPNPRDDGPGSHQRAVIRPGQIPGGFKGGPR
jgi:hypothetical protein